MNQGTQILLSFILITHLSSCVCKNKVIDEIEFTSNDLRVNPYQGNEVLKFIDDNNNTITYTGQFRNISTEKYDGCIECCEDYYNVERVENTYFTSDYMESNLQVNIVMNFDIYTKERRPSIFFAWDYYEIKPYATATTFIQLPIDSMKQKAIEYGIYRDSITLRDKIFYGIYASPGQTTYSERLHGDTLYYSINEGIIGLKFSDGNLWIKK
jgi:hypothetical protein